MERGGGDKGYGDLCRVLNDWGASEPRALFMVIIEERSGYLLSGVVMGMDYA